MDPGIEWLAVEFVALLLTDVLGPEELADVEWRYLYGEKRSRDYYGRQLYEHHAALYFARTHLWEHPLIGLLRVIHPDAIVRWAEQLAAGTLEFAGLDGRGLKTSLNNSVGVRRRSLSANRSEWR